MNAIAALFEQAEGLRRQGRLQAAATLYERILKLDSEAHRACFFLAGIRHEQGDHERAITLLEQAITCRPEESRYYFALSRALEQNGDSQGALAAMETASRLAANWPAPYYHRARMLQAAGREDEAIVLLERFVALRPDHFGAVVTLARLLNGRGRLHEALAVYDRAVALHGDEADVHAERALIMRQLGELEAAVASYERVLELRPDDYQTHSALLALQSYHVMRPPEALLESHRRWDAIHGAEGRCKAFRHARDADVNRRLRVAYISPDLREHAVSFFLRPLLENHDKGQVEVFAYADVAEPDAVSERLAAACDHWRPIHDLDDDAVAEQIHADGIDVLVDLLGHSHNGHCRLRVFTRRPAPVQLSYLGYFSTTGLEAMDYWLSDAVLTPVDTIERTSEEIWRLPRCCLAYRPPDAAPPVVTRRRTQGPVLGCFNNIAKAGPESFVLWAEVLAAIPEARLILKSMVLTDPRHRAAILQRFSDCGIAAERIELRPMTDTIEAHLSMYGEIDIALDTCPRTGGTTTAEALWMGVPVVTLAGERFIERLSATMLSAVGLEDCICRDPAAYVDRVVELLRDGSRLEELRGSLRERMRTSLLCDGRGLAEAIEDAYRQMWRAFLIGKGRGTSG